MGECVIGAIKSSLHFVFQMCRLLFIFQVAFGFQTVLQGN